MEFRFIKFTKPLITFILILFVIQFFVNTANGAKVVEVSIDGMINEGTVITVEKAFKIAKDENADVILILLDTPGGLVYSTEKIVSMILSSDIPVITYVYPQGAFSASAGSLILLSGNIAVMSEGTSVGAATPISVGVDTKVEEKAIKYLASYAKSIAEKRGRNTTIAEKFVTEAYSISASEALEYGVIDLIANSKMELFKKIDGWEVDVNGRKTILKFGKLDSLEIIRVRKPIKAEIFNIITNPEITSILLIIGIYALIYGLTSPGYVPETLGVISLILALAGLGVMSINYLALLLVILSVIFLIAEILTPTYGILGTASIITFVLGMFMLIEEPLLPKQLYESFRTFVIGLAFGVAVIMTFIIIKVAQMRKARKRVGGEAIIGERGIIIESDDKIFARVHGEIWEVESDEELNKGDNIIVIGREGLKLKVRKVGERID